MLEVFDEITSNYKETVIDLLHALRKTTVEQQWVTIRPQLREEFEEKPLQLTYILQNVSEENIIYFFNKMWGPKDGLTWEAIK
jgi:hypothetical protein